MKTILFILLVIGLGFTQTFTLNRSSVVNDENYHVATFNAKEGAYYNCINCAITANLFQNQKNIKTFYWCTFGPFMKIHIFKSGTDTISNDFINSEPFRSESQCDCFR